MPALCRKPVQAPGVPCTARDTTGGQQRHSGPYSRLCSLWSRTGGRDVGLVVRRPPRERLLLVGCFTSQQHASVSQGRICSDNFMCCHTEIEAADPTFYLAQSQYADTRPTSPSADPIAPGAWKGSHWSANFEVTGMTRPTKILAHAGFGP